MHPLVDIGANLTHESFNDDFDEVVLRATGVGVGQIVLTGTDHESSVRASELSAANPSLFRSTAGFHPHVAANWSHESREIIEQLVTKKEVVAVGECGLDFNRDLSPRDIQLSVFEQHLALAAQVQKPVFLHQREAHEPFLDLLTHYRGSLVGGVVHCFTDTRQALEDYLALDMHIGITGWVCDERRGIELQDIVKHIPLERLLIETDAPYLLPRTLRPRPKSRRNEPAYLPEVVRTLALCTGHSEEVIARQTTRNAQRLFGLGNDTL